MVADAIRLILPCWRRGDVRSTQAGCLCLSERREEVSRTDDMSDSLKTHTNYPTHLLTHSLDTDAN
jgi:hypothetical protein